MLEFLEPGVSLILGSRFCIRVAMGPEGLVSTSGCVPVMCVLGMALAPLLTGMTLGFTSPTVDTMKGSVQWDGAPVVRTCSCESGANFFALPSAQFSSSTLHLIIQIPAYSRACP